MKLTLLPSLRVVVESKAILIRGIDPDLAHRGIALVLRSIIAQFAARGASEGADNLAELSRFVVEYFPNLAIKEIALAYDLMSAGELETGNEVVMYYGEMTKANLGATLRAYLVWRNQIDVALHNMKWAEIQEDEKIQRELRFKQRKAENDTYIPDKLRSAKETYQRYGTWENSHWYPTWYDTLNERGEIDVPHTVKAEIWAKAQSDARIEVKNEADELKRSKRQAEARQLILDYEANEGARYIDRAKVIGKALVIKWIIKNRSFDEPTEQQ